MCVHACARACVCVCVCVRACTRLSVFGHLQLPNICLQSALLAGLSLYVHRSHQSTSAAASEFQQPGMHSSGGQSLQSMAKLYALCPIMRDPAGLVVDEQKGDKFLFLVYHGSTLHLI